MANRNIKFRAWDTSKKEWHTDRDFVIGLDGDVLFNLGLSGLSRFDYNCRDQVVCQYTGCKDVNGQEIYEGDIIKQPDGDRRGPVEWISESDGWDFSGWHMKGSRYGDGIEGTEIIGNIFQNPELLSNDTN